jgi:outer membrane protein OmpA-like peptidoglycan-associated protein
MDVSLFGDNEKPAPPAPAPAPLTNEAPPTEVKEQVKTGEEENVNVVLKQRITFTIKNSTLSTKQKTDLDRKVKILEKKPNLKLIVRGNANDFFDKKTEKDSKLKKAAEAQNKKLSAARAKAVKDYMVSKGISTSRIKVVARGSKSRLVPDTTPRNRAKNRRVDFVIVGEK